MARAHKFLVIAYSVVKKNPIRIWGKYYDRLNPDKTISRIQKRMVKLVFNDGYTAFTTHHPEYLNATSSGYMGIVLWRSKWGWLVHREG